MQETGHDAVDVICDLLLAEDLGVNQVTSGPWSETLRPFVEHPVGMVGTDSTFIGAKPSPRTYGSFPRILGQFVRDEGLLSLEEAIHKMTGAAAARLGLTQRGTIRDGAYADLVVFDPATVRSNATYDEPRQFPTGIDHVLVNGTLVVDGGTHTGRDARPRDPPRESTDRGRLTADQRSVALRRVPPQLDVHPLGRQALRLDERRVAGRAGPADGEAERDGARLEPQLAGTSDALDVVDRRDLVGLGQEHAEASGREPGDVVDVAGEPAHRVGQRRDDAVGGSAPSRSIEPIEPIELEDHDRRRPVVALDPERPRRRPAR